MKKLMGVLALMLVFTASASAIEITDISVTPDPLGENDSVNVEATVDAEDDNIRDTWVNVYQNESQIADEQMTLLSGSTNSLATYQALDIFTISPEPATYYVTVTAIATNGESDTESLYIEYTGNTTVIENPEPSTDSSGDKLFGLSFNLWVALILIGALAYAILTD